MAESITKNNFIVIVIVGLIFLLALFLVLKYSANPSIQLSTTGEITRNTITVNGQYTIEVEPDETQIFLIVRTQEREAQKAQEHNRDTSNRVITALRNEGIKNENIETTNYRVELIREYDPMTGIYTTENVMVTNSIKVTIKDLEKVGKILDSATSATVAENTIIQVDNIQFTLSEEKQREVNEALLSKASQNARDKAEAIASSLDVSIVKVVSVSEGQVFTPYPYAVQTLATERIGPPTPILPSDVTASATVNVVFEIA